jgi:catechol 2,3-dioxygenase
MTTDPLDVENLLQEAEADAKASGQPWSGLAPGTTIGHVHLHVSFIEDSEQFYREVLGFDLIAALRRIRVVHVGRAAITTTCRQRVGRHRRSASTGWRDWLEHFEIVLPTATALGDVARRINAAGVAAAIC